MTQKELLYFEDAIKHEQNLLVYLNSILDNSMADDVYKFIDSEIKCHENIKKRLTERLGEESNE